MWLNSENFFFFSSWEFLVSHSPPPHSSSIYSFLEMSLLTKWENRRPKDTCKKNPSRTKNNFQPTIIHFAPYVEHVSVQIFEHLYFSRRDRTAIVTTWKVQYISALNCTALNSQVFLIQNVKIYPKTCLDHNRSVEVKCICHFKDSYWLENIRVSSVQV